MMIRLEYVTKAYPFGKGKCNTLRDINLTIDNGEKVDILGRSSAGKSTLISLLGGVEKELSRHSISWPIAFVGAF